MSTLSPEHYHYPMAPELENFLLNLNLGWERQIRGGQKFSLLTPSLPRVPSNRPCLWSVSGQWRLLISFFSEFFMNLLLLKKIGKHAVMTIRSVKIPLVCNTDFFGKLAKIGQYLVSILGKSQYI